jgi:hypothetical protein
MSTRDSAAARAAASPHSRSTESDRAEETDRDEKSREAGRSDVLGATEETPDATHILVLADGTKVESVGLVSTNHNGVPVTAAYQKEL